MSDTAPPPAKPTAPLFRPEAIEARLGFRSDGKVLRLLPRWTAWTFWLLLTAFVLTIVYSLVGTIDEYAGGAALVQVEGKAELTARAAGTVASVEVKPGQRVHAGQVLVRLHGDEADLERIEQEFQLQLVKALHDPSDAGARASLTTLRTQRELARSRRDERLIKAPSDGVVGDIRIVPGQLLQAGEVVVAVVPDDARFRLIAILPGNYRPRLEVGAPMRVEMAGYRYAYQKVIIESIGDEVVGPTEMRRYLGQEQADALPIAGPVIVVQARLPGRSFEADGKTFDFFDGMQGRAEVRIGSQTILTTLIPSLKGKL